MNTIILSSIILVLLLTAIFWDRIIKLFKKDKLGQIQRAWVKDLKKYPERKVCHELGEVHGNIIKACCLGQAILTYKRIKGMPIEDGRISSNGYTGVLFTFYIELGLNDSGGRFKNSLKVNGKEYLNLIQMNDSGDFTWPEIAKYIENNPENVFNKRV